MNIPIENFRDDVVRLGHQLRDARLSKKMSMRQVAEQLGIDEATVSKIETGKWNASIAFYASMAKALGLQVNITTPIQ